MNRRLARLFAPVLVALGVAAPAHAILFYSFLPSNGAGKAIFAPPRRVNPAAVAVPPGYCIEPVVTGLTYPSGVVTDEHDRVYVLEAGYSYGEDFAPPRILRVEPDGRLAALVTGDADSGPWTGLSYADGAFYVSEGGQLRGAGRVLRVGLDGTVTALVDGLPSIGDHHTNRPVVGPDGWVYFGQGTATNSGVVGEDNAKIGWLKRYPHFHDIPACDITLTGQNFASDNPLAPGCGDRAVTGAFVPFGTPTAPGQVIKGRLPATGAIMRVPAAGGPLELVAWGFRNPFGLTFSPDGNLYCTENQYDIRGSRPVFGTGDLLWCVKPGLWYGWPDFWAGIPLTHQRFKPGPHQPQPQFLLACHPNAPPQPAAILAVHSSSDGLDFSRNPCFGHVGEAFVAVFGDMTAPAKKGGGTGKVRHPIGCRVVRVNVCNGVINDFVINKGKEAGPASKECNGGIERPVDVRFNDDGSILYVVDFGVMTIAEDGKPTSHRCTGVLWRVRRTCGECCVSGSGGIGPAGHYRRGEAIGRPVAITTDARARGEVVYMRHCYACHQGGDGGLGPAALVPGPVVRTQVRAGLGAMPRFGHDEISTGEMNDLIAYLRASRLAGPPYRPFAGR
jgi:glucose/arabinose dehydrogenase